MNKKRLNGFRIDLRVATALRLKPAIDIQEFRHESHEDLIELIDYAGVFQEIAYPCLLSIESHHLVLHCRRVFFPVFKHKFGWSHLYASKLYVPRIEVAENRLASERYKVLVHISLNQRCFLFFTSIMLCATISFQHASKPFLNFANESLASDNKSLATWFHIISVQEHRLFICHLALLEWQADSISNMRKSISKKGHNYLIPIIVEVLSHLLFDSILLAF